MDAIPVGTQRTRVLVIAASGAAQRALQLELQGQFAVVATAPRDVHQHLGGEVRLDLAAVVTDVDCRDRPWRVLMERARAWAPGALRVLTSSTLHAHDVRRPLECGLLHGFVRRPWTPGALLIALHAGTEDP